MSEIEPSTGSVRAQSNVHYDGHSYDSPFKNFFQTKRWERATFFIWTRNEKMNLSFGAGLWLSRLDLFYLVPPTARSSPCPPWPIGLAGHDVDHVWCADSAHFLCITPANVGSVHRFLTVTKIWTSGMKSTFLLSSHPTIKSCPIKKIKVCLKTIITLMLSKLLF